MPRRWYVQQNGKVIGPTSSMQLRKLARSGKVTKQSKVRLGEEGNWVGASSVKGLWTQAVTSDQCIEQVTENAVSKWDFPNQPATSSGEILGDEIVLQPVAEFRMPSTPARTTSHATVDAKRRDVRSTTPLSAVRAVFGNTNVAAIATGDFVLMAICIGSLMFFILRPERPWERPDWHTSVPAFEEAFQALKKHFDSDRNLMPRDQRMKMGELMNGNVEWNVQYQGVYEEKALLNPPLPHFISKLSDKYFTEFGSGEIVRISGTFGYLPPSDKMTVSHRGEQVPIYLSGDTFGLKNVSVSRVNKPSNRQ